MKKIVIAVTAISTVLALSFATARAGGYEVEAELKAELELEQDGADVELEVEAKGLLPNEEFTVRPYISTVTNCVRGAGNALAAFDVKSNRKGKLEIEEIVFNAIVDDIGSVSIRRRGAPPANPPVVCFQDTTP